MNKVLFFLLLVVSSNVCAKICSGKIVEVNHWSDGAENKINFKLANDTDSMWLQTITKEHVSMVLMALASKVDAKVYWSCNAPASCSEPQPQKLCGHLTLMNQ